MKNKKTLFAVILCLILGAVLYLQFGQETIVNKVLDINLENADRETKDFFTNSGSTVPAKGNSNLKNNANQNLSNIAAINNFRYQEINPRLRNLKTVVSMKQGLTPDYNTENIKPLSVGGLIQYAGDFNKARIDGRIAIPSINLNLGIYEGINNEHLYLGAAEQLPRSQVRNGGPGNYILASHKVSLTKNKGFSFIQNIKPGDLIFTTDGENLYTYRVTWNKTVKHADSWALNEPDITKPIITLYSCTEFWEQSDKIVVRGELVGSQPIDTVPEQELDKLFR